MNGIQNGAPDGICLDYQGNIILFISYEGSFIATNGPANGLTSTDIGVSQNGTEPIGSSLGLTGNGASYSELSWVAYNTGNATKGSPNGGEVLPVELSSFSAIVLENSVKLNWRTETEVSNYGFEIERASSSTTPLLGWEKIGFVQGHGNSNSPKDYSFIDDLTFTPALNHTLSYRLKQIDTDGKFEYSKVIQVDLGSPAKFELSQNYPNPFNPVTTIRFTLPQPGNVKLILYNTLGEQIVELVNEFKEAGVHTINFNASELNSGVYIYKLELDGFVQSRKMILLK